MGKRSQRHPLRYEKGQAGCISGLISIFDFRHGRSTRRLLSDRRRESKAIGVGCSNSELLLTNSAEKSGGVCSGEESEMATGNAGKTSVKKLMEEEMFSEHDLKKRMISVEVEAKEVDSEHGGHVKKNHRGKNKASKRSCDIHFCDLNAAENLGPQNSDQLILDKKGSNNFEMEGIMEKLCHQIHEKGNNCVKHEWQDDAQTQSNQNQMHSVEENLRQAIKVFANQKLSSGKHLADSGKIQHSKDFMDALQTLSSNEELFLKLLKDPNSLFLKHIQEMEDAQIKGDQNSKSVARSNLLDKELSNPRPSGLVNQRQHHFFRRKSKAQERNLNGNENSQLSKRIVILKPGQVGLQNSETDSNLSTSLQSRNGLGNKGHSEGVGSQFSFTEIKRKLKHAMGKERHIISSNNMTSRFPADRQNLGNTEKLLGAESGGWRSPNRNHFYNEKFARPSIGLKKGDKIGKPKETETSRRNEAIGDHEQRESSIYFEARKHLSKMLSNGDEIDQCSSDHLPKTLGRILSVPEFNFSPIGSAGKDKDHSFVTVQTELSPCNNIHVVHESPWQLKQENHVIHLGPSRQSLESESCSIDDKADDERAPNSILDVIDEVSYANPKLETSCSMRHDKLETSCSMRHDTSSEGDLKIEKTTETVFQEEGKVIDISGESSPVTIEDQKDDTAEVCMKEEISQCLKLDSFYEDQSLISPLASPSGSSTTKKVEDIGSVNDRAERPSPISVLEPIFTEDDVSPASTKSQPVEARMRPLHIHLEDQVFSAADQEMCEKSSLLDEESSFEFVEAVLLSSDLNWDEFLLRWHSSDRLLDPSLFQEVEPFFNQSVDEQKLLFDSTNEVLEEVCACHFGLSPCVLFTKCNLRPVPRGKDLIDEVWKGVKWHLLLQSSFRNLDHVIKRDLSKTERRLDLRRDTENMGIEMGEAILQELIGETILGFVNEGPQSDLSSLPLELYS